MNSRDRDRDGVNEIREREMAPNNQKYDGFSTERETNENEGEGESTRLLTLI